MQIKTKETMRILFTIIDTPVTFLIDFVSHVFMLRGHYNTKEGLVKPLWMTVCCLEYGLIETI